MAVNQPAIDRLKLDEAFCSGTFKPFNECWTVRMDRELLVVDDDIEKVSIFTDDKEETLKALLIINENNRQIVLLSIDNKLIKDHEGGLADCALFDEEQFRFVEFKTNAYGNSEQAVRDTFDKAVGQLTETIKVFEDKLEEVSIQFKDSITLCCHIVTSQRFPKSKAIKQEYQINFADENNIPLYFSEKTYWESVEEL